MTAAIAKWLVTIVLGMATAALAWASNNLGSGPAIDPWLAGAIVGAVSKFINWLWSKIPTRQTL